MLSLPQPQPHCAKLLHTYNLLIIHEVFEEVKKIYCRVRELVENSHGLSRYSVDNKVISSYITLKDGRLMASQSISTADWIEVTAETLYFEKYLIVPRRGSLANDLQTPIWAISRHCRVPYLIQYAHSRQTTFYEGQEMGVSEPSVHFIKHPQQEMSLSVWDMDEYPLSRSIKRLECCVMAYLNSTGKHPIRQWHSNGPSGSTIVPLTVIRP